MNKARIETISKELKPNEAALITSTANRQYLTEFRSSAGVVFITANGGYFLIDFRYIEKATKSVKNLEVILMKKQHEQLLELIKSNGIEKIYVETESISVSAAEEYQEKLAPAEISKDKKLDELLCGMRAVKTREELSYISKAQEITDKAFEYILSVIKPGLTEKAVALDMEFFMRRLGSEGVAFDFIVVSGANSSLPHGVPTDKKIEIGDFVTMDFGAVVNGYRSDMTRTVAVGKASDEQRKVYNTVLLAQLAAIDAIKAGITGGEADEIARKIITDAGYGECFGHSLGHSVGLEIHEDPRCAPSCKTELKAGTIMTVEPGIYIPDKFGVRIEDMVYITENGCENLTHSPKELIIL